MKKMTGVVSRLWKQQLKGNRVKSIISDEATDGSVYF